MEKNGIKYAVGRSITSVVVSEHAEKFPRMQVFLIFSDNTYLELYSDYIKWTGDLGGGDLDHVVGLSEANQRQFKIYDEKLP